MPPTTAVLDKFNRANATPCDGEWGIGSPGFGKLNLTGEHLEFPSSSYRDQVWTKEQFPAKQEVYFTVPATVSTRFLELLLRITSPNDASKYSGINIEVNTSTGRADLYVITNNKWSASKANGTQTIQAGDLLRGEADGTTVKFFRTRAGVETQVFTVTDASIPNVAGYIGCGMQSSGANLTIDDFGGGSLETKAEPVDLEAVLSVAGALTAELRSIVSLTGSPSGAGTISAELRALVSMEAAPVGTGALSGELQSLSSLIADLTGTGSAAAELTALASMATSLQGQGMLSAGLTQLVTLAADLAGSGSLLATLGVPAGGPDIELPTLAVIEPHIASILITALALSAEAMALDLKATIDDHAAKAAVNESNASAAINIYGTEAEVEPHGVTAEIDP